LNRNNALYSNYRAVSMFYEGFQEDKISKGVMRKIKKSADCFKVKGKNGGI